uniref:Uncharacterized protein n=1 Tax=Arundo donax TaxID=35708 RepID=A0A0A9CMF9_ARUDO
MENGGAAPPPDANTLDGGFLSKLGIGSAGGEAHQGTPLSTETKQENGQGQW